MAYTTICAIVKNEANYIYEWLSYHYVIGIEKFIIFHNSSTDSTLAEIERWPAKHLVQVIEWPYDAPQVSAYKEMIRSYKDAAEWCAFIDVDEYIVPTGSKGLTEILRDLPPDCGNLYIHWLCFGSAGHIEKPVGLVTETFKKRGFESFGPNRYGKSIVRLSEVSDLINPHIMGSHGRILNTRGNEIQQDKGGAQEAASHDLLALNHYFTKSLEEWRIRRALGRPALPKTHPDSIRSEAQFHSHDVNSVTDNTAAQIMQHARALFYKEDKDRR